jgi:hypothetical protein
MRCNSPLIYSQYIDLSKSVQRIIKSIQNLFMPLGKVAFKVNQIKREFKCF